MSDYFNGALAPNKYNSSGEWMQAMLDHKIDNVARFYYLLDWIGNDGGGTDRNAWWYKSLAKMFMDMINHLRFLESNHVEEELEKFYTNILQEIDNLKFVNCSDPSRVAQRAVKKVWKDFHEN